MSVIKLRCNDQVLAFENTPVIASGGLEENTVEFSFCSEWDAYTRTAVFWRSEEQAYHVALADGKTGIVPAEVTAQPGLFYFGVFGVNSSGQRRTTEVLTYRVNKGTVTENTLPSEPTPDIYTQLLAIMAEKFELPLHSPAFTGLPTAPTPPKGDGSTRLATTAFVQETFAGVVEGAAQAVEELREDVEAAFAEASGDPFLWRTVEIVPCNYDEVTTLEPVIIEEDGEEVGREPLRLYRDLPVPLDFDKYKYETKVFLVGLQQYGHTNGNATVLEIGGYRPETKKHGKVFLQTKNTTAEDERGESFDDGWVATCEYRSVQVGADDYAINIIGCEEGEDVVNVRYVHGRSDTGTYPQICAEFDNAYPVQTKGILFSYRAYATVDGKPSTPGGSGSLPAGARDVTVTKSGGMDMTAMDGNMTRQTAAILWTSNYDRRDGIRIHSLAAKTAQAGTVRFVLCNRVDDGETSALIQVAVLGEAQTTKAGGIAKLTINGGYYSQVENPVILACAESAILSCLSVPDMTMDVDAANIAKFDDANYFSGEATNIPVQTGAWSGDVFLFCGGVELDEVRTMTLDEFAADTEDRLAWEADKEHLPWVSGEDDGQMLFVSGGEWVKGTIADSPIKAYIDEYINTALGGEY